ELPHPKGIVSRTVAGQPLILVRRDDGSLGGYHNVCRHRGALLVDVAQDACERGVVTCPYHAWSYDLNGRLLGAPNMGPLTPETRATLGLKPLDVASWHGCLFVRCRNQGPGVDEFLATLGARAMAWSLNSLVRAGQISYRVHANWKLLFENYSECYHCPTVHPALNRLTPYQDSTNDWDSGPILGGPMRLAEGIQSMTTTGRAVAEPLPKLSEEQRTEIAYFTIFPSFFLSLHPDYVMMHRLNPISPAETDVVCEFLFRPEVVAAAGFDPGPALEFWDLTNRQDWHVCERVQAGAASRAFQPGPYSHLESIVAAFDRHYLQQFDRAD
ncbi:MAG TPA: aromatic ring-hydroxylating dioxygenase subunit alpha, partial [Pirellulaceae bacterium]